MTDDDRASLELEELYVKDEGGVGGYHPWVTCCAVRHVWGAGDLRSLAQAHLSHSFLPALDNLLPADLELEGLVSVSRRVKLLPVLQHPYVMNDTCLSFLWKGPSISWRYCFNGHTHYGKVLVP